MPTYEYACTACANEWEAEQSIKDAALTECPKCKAQTAKRQISRGAGFILKGGGWYSDLYSSSGNKKSEGSSSDTSTASESKSETKSEAKSEAKSETKSESTSTSTSAPSTPSTTTSSS